jgi:hypothetical protein
MLLVYGFLDGHDIRGFLSGYRESLRAFCGDAWPTDESVEALYGGMASRLHARAHDARQLLADPEAPETFAGERGWIDHAKTLREDVLRLRRADRLDLRPSAEGDEAALANLLGSYVHMTNNRLGLLVHDEVYLASLLERATEATT